METTQAPASEGPTTPDAPANATPTAAEVLHGMAEAYATASSYEDRGTVTTEFTGSSSHTNKLAFETAFIRSKRFRFEYRHNHEFNGRVLGSQRYTIWSDFAHTYSEWTVQPGIEDTGPNLSLALAGATGVSSGSAIMIPSMLMPDVLGGSRFLRMNAPVVDGSEIVDGHPCWRIKGDMQKDPLTLWIDRDSHMLRRLQESHHFAKFDSVSIMVFEPTVNKRVADARLQPPDLAANPPTPPRPLRPRPWIGIQLDDDTTTINGVVPGGPGAKAGLVAGDQIVAVAGEPVVRTSEVGAVVGLKAIGERVIVTVSRNGSKVDVPVTLGEYKPGSNTEGHSD